MYSFLFTPQVFELLEEQELGITNEHLLIQLAILNPSIKLERAFTSFNLFSNTH